ncbi:hypothetical protein A0H81_05959, partial [Grifola frondosa]
INVRPPNYGAVANSHCIELAGSIGFFLRQLSTVVWRRTSRLIDQMCCVYSGRILPSTDVTPDPSVSVELSSVVRQSPNVEGLADSIRPVGWLRTMIEFDRALVHHWPADCQDWGAVSLGSLDPFLQAVTLSPSNLTVDAGCVLALLNSNLELTIWGAGKNHLQGEWIKAS